MCQSRRARTLLDVVGANMLVKLQQKAGYQTVVSAEDSPLKYLKMDFLRLNSTFHEYDGHTGEEEFLLDILQGYCSILIERHDLQSQAYSLAREDVFVAPDAMFLPRHTRFLLTTTDAVEIAVLHAPADRDGKVEVISSNQIVTKTVGKENWSRDVRQVLPPESDSSRLIVGEIVCPRGNWSGFPAHKHDTISENENALEEIYFYRLEPRHGYGIMRLYDRSFNELHLLENDTAVIITRGYHSAVAAPHTRLFALWALAGRVKQYSVSLDPETSI